MKIPVKKLSAHRTPYYYYDMDVLRATAQAAMRAASMRNIKIHYALKANANAPILHVLSAMGMGADCVSGGEIVRALECGFAPETIALAGVGKTDAEIELALRRNVWCFNCESIQEIQVISQIAAATNTTARLALRINPNVDAHTHSHITTGVAESKFGIQVYEIPAALAAIRTLPNVELIGLHVHIGSQITEMKIFAELCRVVSNIVRSHRIVVPNINLGGGLGVDYYDECCPTPDFDSYFETLRSALTIDNCPIIHVELGRSITAQCASLITKVLYVKNLQHKNFVVVDAGMTDLVRPALYDAYHRIENLTATNDERIAYDVVGPICESTDCFAKQRMLPPVQRGDLLALHSAGAYGEIMASQYNLRQLPEAVYSDAL